MERFFYLTLNYENPYIDRDIVEAADGSFYSRKNNRPYRKRLFPDYDGEEAGYERLPALSFPDLITLVEAHKTYKHKLFKHDSDEEKEERNINYCNYYGAISVILKDHPKDFLTFLNEKANTDFFSSPDIRKKYRPFCEPTCVYSAGQYADMIVKRMKEALGIDEEERRQREKAARHPKLQKMKEWLLN